jgi:hypothetical protein
MNGSSDSLVFWILIPLFLAIGVHLILYTRRRRKMLETFARAQHLRIRPERRQEIEDALNRCFSLEQPGLTRHFGPLSSLIDGGATWIFRAAELLDLDPYGSPSTTNFYRIAAFFPVAGSVQDQFFLLDKHMRPHRMGSDKSPLNPEIVEMTKHIWRNCSARHPLSITLARGYGLIYFEPFVVGGETVGDITSLYCIAKSMHEKLCGNV